MKMERIEWIDSGMAMNINEWAETSLFVKKAREWSGGVVTVGTTMYEDDKVVVVGLTYDEDNDAWFNAQLIYKSCITKRDELKTE